MDDRQTKIREGAGLEDSRVNQEFLDFLNKWSSPVLIVLAVAALVWAGLQKLEQMRNTKIDQAFSELEAATLGTTPSPTSLNAIAEDYAGVRSVPELAKLTAVDIYLRAFTTGVEPGAQVDQATSTYKPEDVLSEEKLNQRLDLAEATANEVLASSENEPGKAMFAMQALTRLAVIQECRDDFDAAKGYYERLKALSEKEQYPSIGVFADSRIANLDSLQSVDALPSRDQVPLLPGETPALTQEQIEAIQAQFQDAADDDEGEADAETPDAVPGDEGSEASDGESSSSDTP
ncbi:MAG: hypothetical protein ACF8K1_04460 [Phycisphaerales bacterium JB047]